MKVREALQTVWNFIQLPFIVLYLVILNVPDPEEEDDC